MRLTETETEIKTTPQPKKSAGKPPPHYVDASKLRKIAESLMLEQYVAPGGRSGAVKLLGRLRKWRDADPLNAEMHTETIRLIGSIAVDSRTVAENLESLAEDYNPGTSRRLKKAIEVGSPARISSAELHLFTGLISDPTCLKVIDERGRQVMVETTTGERLWMAKKHLETIE